jgi:hypothetical protein
LQSKVYVTAKQLQSAFVRFRGLLFPLGSSVLTRSAMTTHTDRLFRKIRKVPPPLAILIAFGVGSAAMAAADQPDLPGEKPRDSGQLRADSSPIGPGFWAWAREELTPSRVGEECRKGFALQFADGNYLGIRFDDGDRPVINEVGRCRYDAQASLERCELTHSEGAVVNKGRIEARFYPGKILRMHVRAIEIGPGGEEQVNEFDVFPVRCPEDTIWGALNELGPAPNP